jgi:hypothetical protein
VTTQPDPKIPGARRLANGYKFFQDWTAGRLPRVIMIYVQNANPYYDDSYDVDSANVGPLRLGHQRGADSGDRGRSIAALGRDGRGPRLAARPAAGRRWRRRSSIPTSTTAPGPPALIRWTSTPTRTSTSTTTPTPLSARATSRRFPSPPTANRMEPSLRPPGGVCV